MLLKLQSVPTNGSLLRPAQHLYQGRVKPASLALIEPGTGWSAGPLAGRRIRSRTYIENANQGLRHFNDLARAGARTVRLDSISGEQLCEQGQDRCSSFPLCGSVHVV